MLIFTLGIFCRRHIILFICGMQSIQTKYNATFWLHLFVTLLSWFLPFLFHWSLALLAYGTVLMQFVVFGACLMNRGHKLNDDGEDTFYAHLLEIVGFKFDRVKVRRFVRFWKYILLSAFTVLWQLILGFEPFVKFW